MVVAPKIMLQRPWQQRLDWDQTIPQEIKDDWIKFSDNVKWLSNLQIPRLLLGESPKFIGLHAFSDSSLVGSLWRVPVHEID